MSHCAHLPVATLSRDTLHSMLLRGIRIIALAAGLAACAGIPASGPRAQMAAGGSPTFFAAAVQHLLRASDVPTRIDPRPLRPESRLRSVTNADILLADTATVRVRTAVLAAAGVPLADATRDWLCVFATGLRLPPEAGGVAEPDSIHAQREACRSKGEYVSLVLGLPQAGTQPEHPRWWRIRAMRMMLHGWEIVDLFLEPDVRGEWQVVDERVRVGAFS